MSTFGGKIVNNRSLCSASFATFLGVAAAASFLSVFLPKERNFEGKLGVDSKESARSLKNEVKFLKKEFKQSERWDFSKLSAEEQADTLLTVTGLLIDTARAKNTELSSEMHDAFIALNREIKQHNEFTSIHTMHVLRTMISTMKGEVNEGFVRSREMWLYGEFSDAFYNRWKVSGEFALRLSKRLEAEKVRRGVY